MKETLRTRVVGVLAAGLMTASVSVMAAPEPVLYFDGLDNLVETGLTAGDLNIDDASPRTVEVWVRTRGVEDIGGIFSVGNHAHFEDFSIRVRETGSIDLWTVTGWDTDLHFEAPGSFNNWTHMAITYDGTNLSAYVNGEHAGTRQATLETTSDGLTFQLGIFNNDYFHGDIRDVRVWSDVRTEAEIVAAMNATPETSDLADDPDLEAWWPMDEGEGSTLFDASGNERDATIFGAQWEAQQFEYDPEVEADFAMDFGIGEDNELSLLRNRPDHFSLQEDALRMTSVSDRFVSSSAVASVVNRAPRQNFVLETELSLNNFPDARASRAGLVVLGGPHVPVEAPFITSQDTGFYALSFFPGVPRDLVESTFPDIEPDGEDTAILAISRGFNDSYLAAVRWDGRRPLSNSTLLSDDFEDPSTDADWQTGGEQNSWAIGVPTAGPAPSSGSRIAATNLAGVTPEFTEDWLRTPVIDLSGVGAARLSFREFLDVDDTIVDDAPAHNAYVRVVDDAGNELAELDRYSGHSGSWRSRSYELPAEVLDQSVRIEFFLQTDKYGNGFGWMIDEVSVETVQEDTFGYALKAEGNYGSSDELELTLTLTDLENGGSYSQSLSTTVQQPLDGNLFGIGGRMQASLAGNPEIDFRTFSMTLGDVQPDAVPTTDSAIFDYAFGSGTGRVSPDRFALLAEEDWQIVENGLLLRDVPGGQDDGEALAVTLLGDFDRVKPLHLESEIHLNSWIGQASQAGMILFAANDDADLSGAEGTGFYSLQYAISDEQGSLVLRQGFHGPVVAQAPFEAAIEGATYRLVFDGNFTTSGDVNFTARLEDELGNVASLDGMLSGPFEDHARFGIGGSTAARSVWEFLNFRGNTTGGEGRFLVLDGSGAGVIESDFTVEDFGIAGNHPKTIEGWFYPRRFGDRGAIQLGNNTANGYDFSIRLGGDPGWWAAHFYGYDEWFHVPGSLNSWNHMAITYDSTTVTIYMNGEEIRSVTPPLDTHVGTGFRIGAWRDQYFDGAVADVRIWDVARTREEIQEGMHASPLGDPGLVAWWPLNEGTGGIGYDASGNGRDLVLPAPEWGAVSGNLSVAGPEDFENHYLAFSGADTVVRTEATPEALGVDGSNPRTLELWVRADDIAGQGALQVGNSEFQQDFSLRELEPQRWQLEIWGPNRQFTLPVLENGWSHIAITYDGETMNIYANGNWIDAYDVFLQTQSGSLGGPLTIGSWTTAGRTENFQGAMRDVRIWSVARTQEQIQETMNASPLGQEGLEGWWPLSEGEGNLAQDMSGNGFDGTIVDPQWRRAYDIDAYNLSRVVRDGTELGLRWSSEFGGSVVIEPGIGDVASAGGTGFIAPDGATTIYTMQVADRHGDLVSVAPVWIRSVPVDGFESARYVRFDIPNADALRDPSSDEIQLSGLAFYRNGVAVEATSATNPGGDDPAGESAANLIDGDPETQWTDLNRAHLNDSHLVIDFGAVVEIDAYQIGTGRDSSGSDPENWRLYARDSESEDWKLIDDMNLDFDLPAERKTLSSTIHLSGLDLSGETFSAWLEEHFTNPDDLANPDISGPLADPAGDGVPNLLKYAFGFAPMTPVSGTDLPQPEVEGGKLRLTYPERIGAADILYSPQHSLDLADWGSEGIQEVAPRTLSEDGEFEWVTVEIELNGQARAFLRVQVEEVE